MKIVELADGFGVECLRISQRPIPEPSRNQIVVKIAAVSLNYRDLMLVTGQYDPKVKTPLVPCSDGAGEIAAVGSDVTGWKEGDRVAGTFFQDWIDGEPTDKKCKRTLGHSYAGVLAEYAVFERHGAVGIPEKLSYEEAACLPCAGLTAWSALACDDSLKPGQTVLIQGSGGVSVFALQFARMMGLRVIATSSDDKKLHRLKSLGAWATINYRTDSDWGGTAADLARADGINGVDHIIEVGGAGTLPQSLEAIKRGGRISLIGVLSGKGTVDPTKMLMKGIRLRGIYVGSRKMFEDMNSAIEHNSFKPVIDKVFALEQAQQAFNHMKSGAHFGKIIIKLN